MTDPPRLLDLFCGAGGCSVGYGRAGFDVTGVDHLPHPDYPYSFVRADARDVLTDTAYLDGFDVIHASPPCQGYSTMSTDPDAHPRLIDTVRAALHGRLYVIENIPGARPHMRYPVQLCGSSFGLGVRRHRLFETPAFIMPQPCVHDESVPVGVYGGHPDEKPGGYRRPELGTSRGVRAVSLDQGRDAMGIDWMGWDDLREAIPPAYTEYLGGQLIDQIRT